MGWTLADWRELTDLEMQYFFASYTEVNKREREAANKAKRMGRR